VLRLRRADRRHGPGNRAADRGSEQIAAIDEKLNRIAKALQD
jgi:hypothetical protein